MNTQKTFSRILNYPAARRAWKELEAELPDDDCKSVANHLLAIANRKPIRDFKPPDRRQARRLVRRMMKLAAELERMNLYYGSAKFAGLPQDIIACGRCIDTAARDMKKMRMPTDFAQREIEIVRLLDHSTPEKDKHYYSQAADLIQAAYDVAKLRRSVDADQLRKLYDRESLKYRVEQEREGADRTLNEPKLAS